MADIFISYARKDRTRIEPLAKSLEELGWSVWWDWVIPVGKTWRQVITAELDVAKCVVVLWSNASIISRWVIGEAEEGLTKEILAPVLIDKVKPPMGLREIQAASLINWTGDMYNPEFEKLVQAIESILGPSQKHIKEAEQAAEKERERKQEEERNRNEDAQIKAEGESRRLEKENSRIADEKRRLEEEKRQVETEHKAEEEQKFKEIEAIRKAEGHSKSVWWKIAVDKFERARTMQIERKAVPEKPAPTASAEKEAAKNEAKQAEPKPSKPKPGLRQPAGNISGAKIGVLIAFVAVIGAGAILLFRPDPVPLISKLKTGQRTFTNSIGMEFVLIPGGKFKMGSQLSTKELVDQFGGEEKLFEREKPSHEVNISQPFYLQTTEVSQGQWKKVMENNPWKRMIGDNPSSLKECDDCPVESVSWEDAERFIKKLNQIEKTTDYRLPSEAEWEYACRAGSETEFSFADDAERLNEFAWFRDNSGGRGHPVGEKKPNAWGLYDMHGNVQELVEDDWHDSYKWAPANRKARVGNPRDPFRAIRGGSWSSEARYCRSAMRDFTMRISLSSEQGFRLAKSVALDP